MRDNSKTATSLYATREMREKAGVANLRLRRITLVLLSGDVVVFMLSFFAGYFLGYYYNIFIVNAEYTVFDSEDIVMTRAMLYFTLSVVALMWIYVADRDPMSHDLWFQVSTRVTVVILSFIVDAVIQYVTKQAFSRSWMIGSWTTALILLPLSHVLLRYLLIRAKVWALPLIVFDFSGRRSFIETVNSNWENDYKVVALEILSPKDGIRFERALNESIPRAIKSGATIVFSGEFSQLSDALPFCREIEANGLEYMIVPNFGDEGRRGLFHDITFRDGVAIIRGSNRLLRRQNKFVKRTIDLFVSSLILVLLGFPMLVLVLLIRGDGGPAIYRHNRVGLGGRAFECLKFRTMKMDADKLLEKILSADPERRQQWANDFKLRDDPRVTGIGSFLRRMSLDELPQLINVMKGEMSLVGPRPVLMAELEKFYGKEAPIYTSVPPGITGLWQVSGRNDLDYIKRVDLDARYVRSWSVFLDIKILLMTPIAVLMRKGAY